MLGFKKEVLTRLYIQENFDVQNLLNKMQINISDI